MKEKLFNYIVFLILDICLTYSLIRVVEKPSAEKINNTPNKMIIIIKIENPSNEIEGENIEDGEEAQESVITNNIMERSIKLKNRNLEL